MRGRLIVSGLTAIASVVMIFATPQGLPAVRELYATEQQSYEEYERATQTVSTAETVLVNTVEEYNNTREFPIYYGDIDRIMEILEGLPGIEIFRTTVVDPTDNFCDLYLYQSGCDHAAIKFELAVSDFKGAIACLENLQIPLYSIQYSHPNTLNVVFLTGGTV